jgi:site-specific recombinase XerC
MAFYDHATYKRTDIDGRTVIGFDGRPTYLRPLENLLGHVEFPELMRNTRTTKVEIQQLTPYRQTLHICDQSLLAGRFEYSLHVDVANEDHAYRLSNIAKALRERYAWLVESGTNLIVPKRGLRIADLTELLVRALPAEQVQRLSIINYARTDDRPAEIVDATGHHRYYWRG